MKLVSLLVLALVGCKSHKPAAPATGSAAAAAPAPKANPTAAPELPKYTAPQVPEGEVEPAQAAAGSAATPVVAHDPVARTYSELDANHDGKLTPDEVRKSLGDDVDTNDDGEISKDELAAGMRAKRLRARASVPH